MKASKLRVGNRIKRRSTGTSHIVTTPILQEIESGRHDYEYETISVNLLKRAGFTCKELTNRTMCFLSFEVGENNYFMRLSYWFSPSGELESCFIGLDRGEPNEHFENNHIKYVHLLQNLYMVETGKELAIKQLDET